MLIRSAALCLVLPFPAIAEPAFAPGTHGEPFAIQGLMQGCISQEDGEFCVVNGQGWRWLVDVTGPTPPDLYRMLTLLPVNAPIQMSGDIIEMGDITAVVAVSDLTAGRDPDARLRALMQGAWTFGSGPGIVQIDGSEWSVSLEGQLQSVSLLQLGADCGDGVAVGGTVITLALLGGDPGAITCYPVIDATLDRMVLSDPSDASNVVMMRQP